MPLTQKQRKQIEAYTSKFKDWLTTEEGREDKLERDERKKKFQNLFSRKNLESLDSPEQFVQMVRDNFWCARNLLRFNEKEIINHGIEKIKGELVELLLW